MKENKFILVNDKLFGISVFLYKTMTAFAQKCLGCLQTFVP